MRARTLFLLATLFAVVPDAHAQVDPTRSHLDPATIEAARLEAMTEPAGPPSEWEFPPEADAAFRDRLGYDVSTTHYARGRTFILHVFINHPGATWTQTEQNDAGAKATVAKNFYLSRSPWGANMTFDDPNFYWSYTPAINWVIPNDPSQATANQACEDACAALGWTDANGNGSRIDDMTLYFQNWNEGWDNVIIIFEPHVTGRAFADFYKGRCVLFMNSSGGTFAHEWGHNYHACDEYEDGGHCWNCDCGPCTEGFYIETLVDNGNCELPICPQDTPCVMKYSSLDVAPCGWSIGQWSWTDTDNDGYLNRVKRAIAQNTYVWIWELYHNGYFYWNGVTDGMEISQRWNNWNVVGIRVPMGADYDITLYGDNNHNFPYAQSAYGGEVLDFIVGDYNHAPPSNEHIAVTHYTGNWDYYNLTWEGGSEMLFPDGIDRGEAWWVENVVRVWDVPLYGGERITFNVANPTGNLDLGMALFGSNGGPYWAGRNQALWQVDASGIGGLESYTWTVPNDDIYGLVVWSLNSGQGEISIRIGPTQVGMAEATVYASSEPLALYRYEPYTNYWAFIGTRSQAGTGMRLGLYDDANFQQLLSGSWLESTFQGFAADYNHGYDTDYLRATRTIGAGYHQSEWEQGGTGHSGLEQVWWSSPHLGTMWDAYLDPTMEYFLREYHDPQGPLDTGIFIFSSADGSYFKNLSQSAAASNWRPASDGGEWCAFVPPAFDWYGVCEIVNNEASGSSSLWLGPRFTFAENGAGARPEKVVWGIEPVSRIYWTVFAARAQPGETVVLDMYLDDAYSTPQHLAGDGPGQVSFVVGDFNHNATGYHYSRTHRDAGGGWITHQWEGGTDQLSFVPGSTWSTSPTWQPGDVAKMWDIYIDGDIPGGQDVTIEVTDLSNRMDLGVLLISSSPYATFWGTRDDGVWSDQPGVGLTERVSTVLGVEDWFGVLVWNNGAEGGPYTIRVIDPTANDVATEEPSRFDLWTTTSNPFREAVGLRYSLRKAEETELAIYDLQGRLVRSLVQGLQSAGSHAISWDARDDAGSPVGSGVYFARLKSGAQQRMTKLIRTE